jgi:hypothetical protein
MAQSDDNHQIDQANGPSNVSRQKNGEYASAAQIRGLGLALVGLILLMSYLFLSLWPSSFTQATSGSTQGQVCLMASPWCFSVTMDVTLMLVVMLAGALGSFIYTAMSFSDYVGNRELVKSWIWWYILKPFIAMTLSLIFYLVLRGGLLSANGSNGANLGSLNLHGIVAISAMVGLFSRQATDKLSEVFNALFRTASDAGDAQRANSLSQPLPILNDVAERCLTQATSDLNVRISGAGFTKRSILRINGAERTTQFDSDTTLTATLLPQDVQQEGTLTVDVLNPAPGGGASNARSIKVIKKQDNV